MKNGWNSFVPSFSNNCDSVTVVGKRRNKGIGLEIPATYTFQHKKPSKLNKLRELLKDKEDKDDKKNDRIMIQNK